MAGSQNLILWIKAYYGKARKDPKISYQELSAEFSNKAGYVSVSYSTVRRYLNKKGIDCYVAARKPLLRITDRVKRYKWYKERLHWLVEDWSKFIFSDDKILRWLIANQDLLLKD